MDVVVSQYNCIYEMQVVAKFLNWQYPYNSKFEFLDNPTILVENKGVPTVKIQINENIIYGFKALMKYWEDNGLWLT